MRAWRMYGHDDLRLDEVPRPEPQPGWALVRVKVVQPSITEAMILGGTEHFAAGPIAKRLAAGEPALMGHEFCGEVMAVGDGVEQVRVGDRVTSMGRVPCGACELCGGGRAHECRRGPLLGFNIPGVFAEYVAVPEQGLVVIPPGPTDHEVAAFQPLAAAVGSVYSAQLGMGDCVVVIGQGVVGLGILQVARVSGAGQLIAVDVRAEALHLSRRFGATATINSREGDAVQAVRDLTGGRGADVVFEAAGGSPKEGLAGFATVQQAMDMVRGSGKVVQSANLERRLELNALQLREKGVRYLFPELASAKMTQHLATLVADGRVQVQPMISHILHGIEKLPEAIEITAHKAKFRATHPAQVIVAAP